MGIQGLDLGQAALQIVAAKQLAARGFRWSLLEVGLLQPALNQTLLRLSLSRPGTARIEAQLAGAEALGRQIQQGVGGAAVPAQDGGVAIRPRNRWQQGEIGDAAEVEQGAPAADAPQQGGVRGRHQGGPLTAEGQVGAAEVEHHGPLQPLGQSWPQQQLPAGSDPARLGGAVPHRLAMAAHQLGQARGITGLGRRRLGFGDRFSQFKPGLGRERCALAGSHQLLTQGRRVGHGGAGQKAPAGAVRPAVELRQDCIDPIGAGAAHQAQNLHRLIGTAGLPALWRCPSPPAVRSPAAPGKRADSRSAGSAVRLPAR